MKKNKAYIIIINIIIIASMFSSCFLNNTNNEDNDKDKIIELTFSTFFEENEQASSYKEIIDEYEKNNTNIKIKLDCGGYQYDEKINNAFKKGNAPDIIGLQRNKLLTYSNEGYLKDLTNFIDENNFKNKIYGVSLAYGKYGDKYFGIGDLPMTVEWFYNKSIFEKYKLNEPKNLDELINLNNILYKRYGIKLISIGANDIWVMNTFFGMIASQTINMQYLSSAFAKNEKGQFLNIEGIDIALNSFNKLLKAGIINNYSIEGDYAKSIDDFLKGKSAILPMGSWAIQKIEKEKAQNFNYGIFEEPIAFSEDIKSYYSATATQVICVNNNTKNSKEVMDFLNYLFSIEAQEIFQKKNGISCLKQVNLKTENNIQNQVVKHLESTNENSIMYIDCISNKMIDSTAFRFNQLIQNKLKLDDLWNIIVEEAFAN